MVLINMLNRLLLNQYLGNIINNTKQTIAYSVYYAGIVENAYLVTPIVAFGTLFYVLNVILSNVLFVRMKIAVMFKSSVIATIVNLTINFVLLYFFRSIIIAVSTTFLSYFIVLYMFIKLSEKLYWCIFSLP